MPDGLLSSMTRASRVHMMPAKLSSTGSARSGGSRCTTPPPGNGGMPKRKVLSPTSMRVLVDAKLGPFFYRRVT